jgi:thiamine transport system permease protein
VITKFHWLTALWWLIPLAFLGMFFFYPLTSLLVYTVQGGAEGSTWSVWQVVSSPATLRVVWFSVWQAALSTFLTLLIGLPGAYLFGRFSFRGRGLLQTLTAIPFIMPTLVVAAAFNALLGPRGWINQALMSWLDLGTPPIQFMNTLGAILVAHVFYNTTIILRSVGDFWSRMDPRMEQAARSLGANRWQTWWKVTLPLLAPAVSAAALLVFIFNFTSFGVVLILGGPRFATLEVEIYTQAINLLNLPQAATLSILQMICTTVFTLVYQRLSNRTSQSLSLKPRIITQKRLVTWQSRLSAGLLIIFLVVLLITPLLALALRSVTQIGNSSNLTENRETMFSLDFYRELNLNRRQSLFYSPPSTAMMISLGYAAATVALTLSMGAPAAWVITRSQNSWMGRALDAILMLPLGASSVTLGLGFILALSKPPLDLRSSPMLIPLAHTLVALPFVIRSLLPALRSIRPRLHQAASVLGASPMQVIRLVDLPLVSRSVLVAATYAFTISMGEFGATALLARPEYPTIPVAIYRFLGQPGAMNYGQALALSTVLMLVCAGGMLVIERLRLPDSGEF